MTPIEDFSPEDESALDALGEEVSRAAANPFLARCLVEAFLTGPLAEGQQWWQRGKFVGMQPLTFRSWLVLETIRSPFLVDDWNGMSDPEQIGAAVGVLVDGRPWSVKQLSEVFTPAEATLALRAVREVIRTGFSTAIRMRRPNDKTSAAAATDHGFGAWISLLTGICRTFGCLPSALMDFRVDQAFAITSTARYLDGAEPSGANYLEREILTDEESLFVGGVPQVQADGQGETEHVEHGKNERKGEAEESITPTAEDHPSEARNE